MINLTLQNNDKNIFSACTNNEAPAETLITAVVGELLHYCLTHKILNKEKLDTIYNCWYAMQPDVLEQVKM